MGTEWAAAAEWSGITCIPFDEAVSTLAPCVEQHLDRVLMTEEAGKAERAEAVIGRIGHGIGETGIAAEQRGHAVHLSQRRRLEDIERLDAGAEAGRHLRLVMVHGEENRRHAVTARGGELRRRPHQRFDGGAVSRGHRRPESRLVGHAGARFLEEVVALRHGQHPRGLAGQELHRRRAPRRSPCRPRSAGR